MVRILASLALLVSLAACDVGTFPVEGEGAGTADAGGVLPLAFNGSIQQDFMTGGCLTCHGATPLNNDYSVTTFAGASLAVVPNDPAASPLVGEMDPAGPPRAEHAGVANAIRLQLYTDWINAGAPETAPAGL